MLVGLKQKDGRRAGRCREGERRGQRRAPKEQDVQATLSAQLKALQSEVGVRVRRVPGRPPCCPRSVQPRPPRPLPGGRWRRIGRLVRLGAARIRSHHRRLRLPARPTGRREPVPPRHRHGGRLRQLDLRGPLRHGHLRQPARHLRQLHRDRQRRRCLDRLRPHPSGRHLRARRAAGVLGTEHRVGRDDRRGDRMPPPLRGAHQRGRHQQRAVHGRSGGHHWVRQCAGTTRHRSASPSGRSTLTAVTAAFTITPAVADEPTYPSWQDVQNAANNESAAKAEVAKITKLDHLVARVGRRGRAFRSDRRGAPAHGAGRGSRREAAARRLGGAGGRRRGARPHLPDACRPARRAPRSEHGRRPVDRPDAEQRQRERHALPARDDVAAVDPVRGHLQRRRRG